MRKDLGGGHWVDLKDRLTWAERNRIRDSAQDGSGFYSGFVTTLCRTYVSAWDVGGPAPDDEGWAALDADIGDTILKACLDAWNALPDPKGIAGTSSSS